MVHKGVGWWYIRGYDGVGWDEGTDIKSTSTGYRTFSLHRLAKAVAPADVFTTNRRARVFGVPVILLAVPVLWVAMRGGGMDNGIG